MKTYEITFTMSTRFNPHLWPWAEMLDLENGEKIHSVFVKNIQGKSHNIEPDDLEDFICAVWFEDMPDDEEEVRAFHRDALANITNTTGIEVRDLQPKDSEQPDYDEVERRVHDTGLDTYNSDTRLIIFPPKPEQES